jgi:hypothetical protein
MRMSPAPEGRKNVPHLHEPADPPQLIHYIQDQEKRHRKLSFQDEFRAFLRKQGIAFDERYVWG